MYLQSRFSPASEVVSHPLISHALRLRDSESLRIINFEYLPTKKQL